VELYDFGQVVRILTRWPTAGYGFQVFRLGRPGRSKLKERLAR
jgi:hypothetical protein